MEKYKVEMDGVCVYASKSYRRARSVAWRLIHKNKSKEIIVHLGYIIVGI